jgi:hypothetical protein
MHETQVTQFKVRDRRLSPDAQQPSQVEWREPASRRPGEQLLKNFAVAAALVLCAVVLRTGAVPPLNDAADVILTAATDQSLLDDQLGKLSFVSTLFPEAVLVFGESSAELAAPVSGGMVMHAWSESEPWMSWRTSAAVVTASAGGEVIGVYHGIGDERMVQVQGSDGLKCTYGNLAEVSVRTGDSVSAGDVIGMLLPGEDFVMEVYKGGKSVDPARYLQ